MPLEFPHYTETYGFPGPRDDQTPKDWMSAPGTQGDHDFYTVPAGKVVYVTSVIADCSTGTESHPTLQRDATVVARIRVLENMTFSLHFTTPLKYAAGEIIRVWFDNTGDSITVIGWEEDAA